MLCEVHATRGHSAAAQPVDMVQAVVAGRRYSVPRLLLPDQDDPAVREAVLEQFFSVQPSWPGLVPVLPGKPRTYESGLIDVTVQDISPRTEIEDLAGLPTQRARFLALWRNSTVDQFALSTAFDLAPLSLGSTAEASRLGLRSLGPLGDADAAEGRRLFADGLPAELSVIMMCRAGLSCQMWWMQDEAAVEVTFAERFLPE